MKEHISYVTQGTCSRKIEIDLDGDTIEKVEYIGGCHGNTQGVAALLKGMTIDDAIARLDGIKCGFRPTSCPDQLAQALKKHKESR